MRSYLAGGLRISVGFCDQSKAARDQHRRYEGTVEISRRPLKKQGHVAVSGGENDIRGSENLKDYCGRGTADEREYL